MDDVPRMDQVESTVAVDENFACGAQPRTKRSRCFKRYDLGLRTGLSGDGPGWDAAGEFPWAGNGFDHGLERTSGLVDVIEGLVADLVEVLFHPRDRGAHAFLKGNGIAPAEVLAGLGAVQGISRVFAGAVVGDLGD